MRLRSLLLFCLVGLLFVEISQCDDDDDEGLVTEDSDDTSDEPKEKVCYLHNV